MAEETPRDLKPAEKAVAPAPAKPSGPPLSTLQGAGAELLPQASDLARAVDPWGIRELMQRPGRLLWINFLAGLTRGVGFTVGVTVLGGLFLSWALSMMRPMLEVPVLGRYVAEVVATVQTYVDSTQPQKSRKPKP